MELYSRLYQPQLFAWQVAGKNFTICETNRCLKLGVFGMNVRQVVMPVVDQIKADDDAVKHGDDWHSVVLEIQHRTTRNSGDSKSDVRISPVDADHSPSQDRD